MRLKQVLGSSVELVEDGSAVVVLMVGSVIVGTTEVLTTLDSMPSVTDAKALGDEAWAQVFRSAGLVVSPAGSEEPDSGQVETVTEPVKPAQVEPSADGDSVDIDAILNGDND